MPDANDDSVSVQEDRAPNPVTGNVLINDIDTLSVTSFGAFGMDYGTLILAANGDYSYTLDNTNPSVQALGAGDTLTEAFIYNVSGDFATLTITIQGTPENEPPVLWADTRSITEDTAPNPITGNVLINDSDADGDTLSVTNPGTFNLGHGTLVINANGSYTYTLDNSNPAVNALNTGQTLTDSFTYLATDGAGNVEQSTLTIIITGSTDNRPPVATADTNSVREDTVPNRITGNVLTNDSDPDGNTLSVASAGTFTLNYGVIELHADGSYTYTLDNSNPAVNALNNGQTLSDTFTYNISDGHGGTTSSSLTVTINGSTDNRPPVAVADINSITEDTAPNPITGNVLSNDTDPDGNTLSVTNAGTFTLDYGVLEIHADGSYTYTLDNTNPAVDALDSGETLSDAFTYSVSDEHGSMASSSLTITIEGTTPNLAPVNTTPGPQTVLRSNTLVFSAATGNGISVGDVDAGSADVEVTLNASSGAMTLSQTTGLTFTLGDGVSDSSFTFTGTMADINAALDGLEIVSDTVGALSIQMTTSDLGNTGSGGALVDTDIISVDVQTNVIQGGSKGDRLRGTALDDELLGLGGKDIIEADAGDDVIRGGGGDDKLYGQQGNDTIDGGAGNDRIISGGGADTLTGGEGADVFIFRGASSTTPTVPDHDTITDFSLSDRDRIDLHLIDANESKRGDQAFAFIGTDAFNGKAGELRVEDSGGHTFVYGDTNGDGTADLVIEFSSAIALRARHFDL